MATPGYGQGERETLRELIEEIGGLDYRALLSYLLNQEMKKAEMYNTLRLLSGEAVWDQRVTGLFKVMYEESVGNAERLFETFRREFPGENPAEIYQYLMEKTEDEKVKGLLRGLSEAGLERARNLEEVLSSLRQKKDP
ncbi:hypothetical protein [Thermococcus zilligii]|uniref:hypothetical protein n=1 Tax=Thermococcus zilligii TaxID=54076 RepID=UPI00029A6510|nr:hypothetical protein [Thermococcus zilligii]